MSLSQSTSARHGLEYLQSVIGGGYLRDRGTGMSDLVVTSRPLLVTVLEQVRPFVVVKRRHVDVALWLLPQIRPRMEPDEFLFLAKQVDDFASLNHSKTKRISAVDVEQHLRGKGFLAPVSTSSSDSTKRWIQQQFEIHNTPAPRKRVKV